MVTQMFATREQRGQVIAQSSGQVKRIDEYLYIVKSQSGNGEYTERHQFLACGFFGYVVVL